MFEEISQIQSTIQIIQSQLSALSSSPPAAPSSAPSATGQPSEGASFAQTLQQAQAGCPVTESSPAIAVPPASLGPLPPLPVSPDAPGVVPLPISLSGTSSYGNIIQACATKNGLDPALLRAVIQTESGGNPKAVSRVGAMGLMQLMPATAQGAGVTDPFDPEQNIAAGAKQLAGLLQQYHGNLDLALAAYNAGPANVLKYGGVPPFQETQQYLIKIHQALGK